MAVADKKELMNSYDNTIIYTDYLVHSVIETLKEFPDRRSCVIFISDHGESLGENGLYMLHSLIKILRDVPERRSCMLFISDHGESLGENNLYMHGVPMSMAPAEQVEIPFIVWTSDNSLKIKDIDPAGPYNIYHTVLDFLGMETAIFDESKTIFE